MPTQRFKPTRIERSTDRFLLFSFQLDSYDPSDSLCFRSIFALFLISVLKEALLKWPKFSWPISRSVSKMSSATLRALSALATWKNRDGSTNTLNRHSCLLITLWRASACCLMRYTCAQISQLKERLVEFSIHTFPLTLLSVKLESFNITTCFMASRSQF